MKELIIVVLLIHLLAIIGNYIATFLIRMYHPDTIARDHKGNFDYLHVKWKKSILRLSKSIKILGRYRILKWKNKSIKVPQNSLKPMSTIQVIGYIPENRTTIDEFLYELDGRRFMSEHLRTKEK